MLLWIYRAQQFGFMRKVGKGTAVVDGAATVMGALTGQVRYAWSGSDTASIGTSNGEFEVVF